MLVEGDLIPGSSRMGTIYGSENPNQQVEHPPPVQNRLSENDLVYFIPDTVTELDISTITDKYQQRDRLYVTDCRCRELPDQLVPRRKRVELIWRDKAILKTKTKNYFKRKAKIGDRSDEWPNRERNRTAILDIPEESEIRSPTWEEAARKSIKMYREVISKHCTARQ
jgi:hypothetical protein